MVNRASTPPMTDGRQARFVGRSILRREDQRLLRGQGQFIADIVLPRMLHAVIVRSSIAHARIRAVDVSRAASAPGVVLALAGAELARLLPPVPGAQLSLPSKWRARVEHKLHNPQQPLLAIDKVRHVGEGIAVVVAESREAAEDAAELVQPDMELLPAVVDPELALRTGAPLVHDQLGTNLIGEFTIGKGSIDAALRRAPKRLKRRFYHHRYSGVPMECRGVIGVHDRRTDSVTIWSSTQVVHWVRREAATILELPESRVRCVAPDVGGGFGVKGHVYPEDVLIPFLARRIGRPVRWIEDRREHFLSATHARDQIHEVEIGFDEEGGILALRDFFMADCGAWNPIGAGIIYNTAAHLLGPYKVEHFAATAKVVATNKVPSSAYRGAGRPEASFAMERSMDLVASAVGLEPAEVRRRNMVRADEMPYSVGIPYRDGVPIVYDSGDFPRAFDRALQAIGGIDEFRRRQRQAREQGRALGLGFGCYTEGTGAGPFEGATVRIDGTGQIHVASGACPMGNGQETVYAQLAAELWKVPLERVTVSLGDTAAIPIGFGSIASRSTVLVSAAMHEASERVRRKAFAIAAHRLECDDKDLELREGGVGVRGVRDRILTHRDLARAAGPQWDHGRPPGI